MSKDETIYIRIGSELRKQLDKEARQRGEALSVIVRQALREYFRDKDNHYRTPFMLNEAARPQRLSKPKTNV